MPVKSLTVPCCLALLFAARAGADGSAGLQSLDAVRAAAEHSLRQQIDPQVAGIQLQAAALDARLRLPVCAAPLESYAPPPRGSQNRAIVRVGCNAGASWTLNVPVEIRREVDVLTLRRAVTRGETLTAADVVSQKRLLAGLGSPYVARVDDLAGRFTRRPLAEGTALTAESLSAALLIHRGQTVTLAASTGGIEIRATGRAMTDAAASQRLRVQNLDSLKVVEGVAESDGVVRVSP